MQEKYLTRQLDLISGLSLKTKILVVGAGAIGSFTVLTLAKMGFSELHVMDDDTIENENMNCQFYKITDIGRSKVDALQDQVYDFTGTTISVENNRFTEETDTNRYDIVISALDCMEARKIVFNKTFRNSFETLLIDPRMAAENILLFAGQIKDESFVKSYQQTLYTNESAVQERCTAKSTMYTVNLIAGTIGKIVKDYVLENEYLAYATWAVDKNSAIWFSNKNSKLTQ